MFDIRINSIFSCTFYCFCSHISCKNSVFGEIFIVSCSKCSSVSIHTWRIPAFCTHFLTDLTHAFTPCLCKFLIPCGSNHNFNWKSNRTNSCKVVINCCRSIEIKCSHFSHRIHGCCLITSHCNHICHFINSKLIQKFFPTRIVIISITHIR